MNSKPQEGAVYIKERKSIAVGGKPPIEKLVVVVVG